MTQSVDLLLCSIAVLLIAVLVLAHRLQGRAKRKEQMVTNVCIAIEAKTADAMDCLRPVTAELERQAELVERIERAVARNAKVASARRPRESAKESQPRRSRGNQG